MNDAPSSGPRFDMEARRRLKAQAVRAASWVVVHTWVTPVISLATFLVVVRLIGPEAYGLFAMAVLLVQFAELLVMNTLSAALVQRRQLLRPHIDAVFWVMLASAMALSVAIALMAGTIGVLFDDSRVTGLTRWLSLAVLISAISEVPKALVRRSLQFRVLTTVSFACMLAGAGAGIGAALGGWGARSLVVQLLVTRLTEVLLIWPRCGWHPGLSFSARRLRELMGFSLNTLGLRITKYAFNTAPKLIIGVVTGPTALGFYATALRVYHTCRSAVVGPVSTVTMPVAARAQGDPEVIERIAVEGTRVIAIAGVPVFCGLSVTAPEFVPLLFGEQGIGSGEAATIAAAVQVAQILPLSGIPVSLSTMGMGLLRGTGRPGWRLFLALAQLATTLVLLLCIGGLGLTYVAIAMAGSIYLVLPLKLHVMRRVIGIPLLPHLRTMVLPLVASAAMASSIILWRHAVFESFGAVALLVSEVLLGISVYVALLLLLARDELLRLVGLLRGSWLPGGA